MPRFLNLKRNLLRVKELEQKNIELKTRLAILEQGKEEKSIYTEDVLYSSVKSNNTHKQLNSQCDDTTVSDIINETSNSNVFQGEMKSIVSNTPLTRCSESPIHIKPITSIHTETKLPEDKEIDNFLNSKYKEKKNFSNSISDKQILGHISFTENMLDEADLTLASVSHLAHLFDK
ncbi:10133_t:CDS:2, partial [Diversispora eburnea]